MYYLYYVRHYNVSNTKPLFWPPPLTKCVWPSRQRKNNQSVRVSCNFRISYRGISLNMFGPSASACGQTIWRSVCALMNDTQNLQTMRRRNARCDWRECLAHISPISGVCLCIIHRRRSACSNIATHRYRHTHTHTIRRPQFPSIVNGLNLLHNKSKERIRAFAQIVPRADSHL